MNMSCRKRKLNVKVFFPASFFFVPLWLCFLPQNYSVLKCLLGMNK